MSNESIDFKKVLNDSRDTLLNPKGYFASMPLAGGIAEPVIKGAMYGVLAGLFSLLWSVTGFSVVGAGMLGGAVGFMALVWSVIGAIIGLFIGGVLVLVISAICGGNTDYEANLRVAASLMVLYPINAFFAFSYGISFTLGGVIALLVSLYSLYLLYHAVIHALKGKESTAKIVAIVLLVLSLLVFLGGRRASKSLMDYSDMFEEEQVD